MEVQPREIQNYLTAEGRSPFEEWLDSLRDRTARVHKNKTSSKLRNIGEIMKEVKTPTSRSYREYLISSLKDPQEAAAYIETFLESEEDSEPELLGSALKDVIDARVLSNNLSEKAKQHYEKLDKMLSETGGAEIYALVELLDALLLRMAIAPK